jgi:hypothetical protein
MLCCPTTTCLGSTYIKVSHLGYALETVTPEDALITCRLKLTCDEDGFRNDGKPYRSAKEVCPVGHPLARLGLGFVPHHLLMSYFL